MNRVVNGSEHGGGGNMNRVVNRVYVLQQLLDSSLFPRFSVL